MEKTPYENPVVFDFKPPKKQKDKIEELRQGIIREQKKRPIWQHKYFFVAVALIILLIFIIALFLLR